MNQLPILHTVAEIQELRANRDRWVPALLDLARLHGLPEGPFEDFDAESLVVGVGAHHIIKLFSTSFPAEYAMEGEALRHLYRALPCTLPTLIATRSIPGWDYIVMTRVSGQTLYSCWQDVPNADKLAITRDLGRCLAALHAFHPPVLGPLFEFSWANFLANQIASAESRHRKCGASEAVLAGFEDCFSRAALPATVSAVLHADLTGQNVMIDCHNGHWRLEGIIDFGDARVGHPLYDLATPAILIAGGDAELFSALLTGYGIPHAERTSKLRDQLMANALLHPYGDITRCYASMSHPPKSLDEVAEAIFPF